MPGQGNSRNMFQFVYCLTFLIGFSSSIFSTFRCSVFPNCFVRNIQGPSSKANIWNSYKYIHTKFFLYLKLFSGSFSWVIACRLHCLWCCKCTIIQNTLCPGWVSGAAKSHCKNWYIFECSIYKSLHSSPLQAMGTDNRANAMRVLLLLGVLTTRKPQ